MDRTFRFGRATCPGLNRHRWLAATTLNSVALESCGPRLPRQNAPRCGTEERVQSAPHMLSPHSAPQESSRALTKDGRCRKEKEQKWSLLTNHQDYHLETPPTQSPHAFCCLWCQKYDKCHKRFKLESNFWKNLFWKMYLADYKTELIAWWQLCGRTLEPKSKCINDCYSAVRAVGLWFFLFLKKYI